MLGMSNLGDCPISTKFGFSKIIQNNAANIPDFENWEQNLTYTFSCEKVLR
jgi:hypothetical protein